MPNEIVGILYSLRLEPLYAEGIIGVEVLHDITYGNEVKKTKSYVRVKFLVDNKEAIDIIRKSDGKLRFEGRFDNENSTDGLCFFIKKAEEGK